jgi:hypothetical protein
MRGYLNTILQYVEHAPSRQFRQKFHALDNGLDFQLSADYANAEKPASFHFYATKKGQGMRKTLIVKKLSMFNTDSTLTTMSPTLNGG